MFAYLDTVPDLKFYLFFITFLAAVCLGQRIYDRLANKKAGKCG